MNFYVIMFSHNVDIVLYTDICMFYNNAILFDEM